MAITLFFRVEIRKSPHEMLSPIWRITYGLAEPNEDSHIWAGPLLSYTIQPFFGPKKDSKTNKFKDRKAVTVNNSSGLTPDQVIASKINHMLQLKVFGAKSHGFKNRTESLNSIGK